MSARTVARRVSVATRAEGASKVYGEGETAIRALDEVDVSFEAGRFSAIMGPSGSEKSTLLPLFLLVGGTIAIATEDEPNRTDGVGLSGTAVQAIGLVVALIAGLQVLSQVRGRRD